MNNRSSEAKESLLSTVAPAKAIVKLAIPATLALLAKAVYNIVDTAYIGMLRNDNALAAVGVTLPLLLIMVSLENIFAAGAAVLAGRQLGAGEKEKAGQTVTHHRRLFRTCRHCAMCSGCSSPPFLICRHKA